MQLLLWLRKHLTGRPLTRRAPAGRPTPRFRPRLEALEGRDVPSTLTVTTNLDSGAGSLRAEVAAAQNNDTIVFAPNLNGQTITLTSGELYVTTGVTIQGPGAGQLTVSGNNQHASPRVFEINASQPVVLSGLTISGAGLWGGVLDDTALTISGCTISNTRGPSGAGIYNRGTLTLTGSTLSGNTAFSVPGGSGGVGGGIYNGGTLTASGCTLSANTAQSLGGGVYAAYHNTTTLTNCTLSNNSALGGTGNGGPIGGGGISVAGGTVNLTNCTLSLNAAKYGGNGGGIYATQGILNLANTIVAGNTAQGYPDGPDIFGRVATADHNLVGDGYGSSGIVNGVNGNIVGTPANPIDPRLGPLQNNGGPTQTMALLAGSPAIGHANNSKAPATDQRGIARLDDAAETTDIGAFEL